MPQLGMTLQQYQRAASLLDEQADHVMLISIIMSDMYGIPFQNVGKMSPRRFLKYTERINRLFSKVSTKPLIGWFRFETNAKKITFGQFIETQHFIKLGKLDGMNYIAATIWQKEWNYQAKVNRMTMASARMVVPYVIEYLGSFKALISEYKGLFEIDDDPIEDMDEPLIKDKPHPFVEQYGWIFSAKEVAEHEGITLDQAFDLPVIQALNDLAYLKSLKSYQRKQMKG